MQSSVELIWELKSEKAEDFHGFMCVSRCRFFLDSLEETEWFLWLKTHNDNLRFLFRRASIDKGPTVIEFDWDIHLLAEDGKEWGGIEKTRTVFRNSGGSDWMILAKQEDIADHSNGLLVQDTVRVCLRIWPINSILLYPAKYLAHSNAGVRKKVSWTVENFSSLNSIFKTRVYKIKVTARSEDCPDVKLHSVACDLKMVVFIKGGKVHASFNSDKGVGCVLMESVHIVRSDGEKFLCWEGKRYLDINNGDQELPFIEEHVLTDNRYIYLPNDELTLYFTFIDYISYSACLAHEVVTEQVQMPSNNQDASVLNHGKTLLASSDVSSRKTVSAKIRGFVTDEEGESNIPSFLFTNVIKSLEDNTFVDKAINALRKSKPSHKNLLRARSPVSGARFKSSIVDNVIEVTDFTLDLF